MDVKGVVKQYWPYLLGGAIGIFILLRYAGGSSGGAVSGGGSDYAAFLQAQTAAAAQNAQIQAQVNAQQADIALKNKQLEAAVARDNAALELQRQAVAAEAFNNFQSTQAAMAQSIGSSTAQVIGALNNPAIAAMQANATENAAALLAAAQVAGASFSAQAEVLKAIAQTSGQAFQAIPQVQLPTPSGYTDSSKAQGYVSKGTQWVRALTRGYAAYQTGGLSEMSGYYGDYR